MSLDLTAHFSHFLSADKDRLHLAAHSHHFWPDAARAAQLEMYDDAARLADRKWGLILGEILPEVQQATARILNLPDPASIALAPNTLEFVKRLLSCLPAGRPSRILTSDSEFHSFSRQIARLEEEGLISVTRIEAEPFDSFADNFRAAAELGGWDMIFVSQVFFNSGATSGDIAALVEAVPDDETLIVIDGYHGYMALPTDLSALANRIFYLAGGYKYAMAGEGVCFMHCPPGYGPRPRDTGWYAAFGALEGKQRGVAYAEDGRRFFGATFDASGLYRQRAVHRWLAKQNLTVEAIHAHVLACQDAFLTALQAKDIPGLARADLLTPMPEDGCHGHFLTYRSPHSAGIHTALMAAGIVTDLRDDRLRFGFGCYHRVADMPKAVDRIATALKA